MVKSTFTVDCSKKSMGTFSGLNPDRTDMQLGSQLLRNICRTQQFFGANVIKYNVSLFSHSPFMYLAV